MRKKRKIYYLVRKAEKTGGLVKKQHCEICNNSSSKIEAHHEDYNKPLDVIYLCFVCHRKIHAYKNYKKIEKIFKKWRAKYEKN